MTVTLLDEEALAIATILSRRANEIAGYKTEHKDMPASVDYALTLEIDRLRTLSAKVQPVATVVDLHS